MQRTTMSLLRTSACAALALGLLAQAIAADAKKADPAGTWTWSTPGRNGGPDRVSTLKLKLEGEKLTGTLSTPGRGGGAATDTAISDGKLAGDQVSFSVTRDFGGNTMTTKYSGKIDGDTIKGKIEMPSRDGGAAEPRDWEAKRQTEKSATPAAEKKGSEKK